jgi:hypothetical protein
MFVARVIVGPDDLPMVRAVANKIETIYRRGRIHNKNNYVLYGYFKNTRTALPLTRHPPTARCGPADCYC